MFRANRLRVWSGSVAAVTLALFLMAPAKLGFVGAASGQTIMPGGAMVVPGPATPDARLQAKNLLMQARAQLAQGHFDGAEALATEVAGKGLTFTANEDSPAKVFNDVKKARTEPRALLTAARFSLSRKEYDRAEKFAKLADQNGSVFVFPGWGDTPAKALRDIDAVRKAEKAPKQMTSEGGPQLPPVVSTKQPEPPPTNPPAAEQKKPAMFSAPKTQGPTNDTVAKVRGLLKQGRDALKSGKVDEARRLCGEARALRANLGWWEDNPDRLEADIRQADTSKNPPTTTVKSQNQPAGVPRDKDEARNLLVQGRKQLTDGKLDEAAQTAQRVKAMPGVSWGLFDDSPDRLILDVDRARTKRDRDDAIKLLAEGRQLYEKGDYDGATKLAHRSQKLHGSYSIWELGDRPSKLLSDCEQAKARARKTDLPPALARDDKPAESRTQPNTSTLISGAQTPVNPKLKAQQLVGEAQRLKTEGRLVEARKKVTEAQKLNVLFGIDEVSPEVVNEQITVEVTQRIGQHLRKADDARNGGNNTTAEVELTKARQLAASFGHDTRPIDQRLTEARSLVSKNATPPAPAPRPPVANPVPPPPPVPGSLPGTPELAGPPGGPQQVGVAQVQHTAPVSHGQTMLEKARLELRSGEASTARRLAEEAFKSDPKVRDEAMAVLRTIDAEELNQKRLATNRAFDAANSAFGNREYAQAGALLAAIDTRLLDAPRQSRLREIGMTPEMSPTNRRPTQTTGQGPTLVRTGGAAPLPAETPRTLPPPTPSKLAGVGQATVSDADGKPDPVTEHRQRQRVLYEQLTDKGMRVQTEAGERFRAGQHQYALEMLQDFLTDLDKVPLGNMEMSRLKRPVEARLSHFRLLAAQKELAEGRTVTRNAAQDRVNASRIAEETKRKNVEKLMRDFTSAYQAGKYVEAESIAMKASELDPDNGIASAAVHMAKRHQAVDDARALKQRKEEYFVKSMGDAEDPGSTRAITQTIDFNEERWKLASKRKPLTPIRIDKPTEKHKAIERSLLSPVSATFENTPLRQVIDELRDTNGLNIVVDSPALAEYGITLDSPVTIKFDRISLKSALNLILHQVKLTYVIKDEVLQVTTEENARGKLVPVTYQVADLVIPIENFDNSRIGPMPASGASHGNQPNSTPSPVSGIYGMNGGSPVGTSSGSMLENGGQGDRRGLSSNGSTSSVRRATNTMEEQLIRLLTASIQPKTWSDMGGPGTIEFHPMTMALIINQTADIQEQIQDLLAALRRLQDQQVAVEVRFISVSEDFFERVGVNFNLNILTDTTRFQPELLNNSFVTDPTRFINAFNPGRFLAGATPAGSLTPTLDIPISNQSFFQTIPNFGGYTAGGLTMGLAFLSDIQVFLFLEAVQGDLRSNVMQAPKLTLFNGQTANLTVGDQQSFVSGVQVSQLPGGQFALVPQNNPQVNTTTLQIQAVISADRRFARLSLQPFLQNIIPGPIQVFPVVVPIFTSIEGNQSGQPVVFTQYLQQPVQTFLSVSTTVAVPDGGTVLMGGLKRLSEARSEFGPPILSKIPYINRLFKNVGYGRETDSLLIMVTVRIIIQEEEEERQTGFRNVPAINN